MRESPTLAVKMEAERLRAEGVDIVDFGPGEPDFATPAPICRAAESAIAAGHTHYTDTAGIVELRSVIARTYADRYRTPFEPGEVLVGCGAKNLLFLLNLAMFQPGDKVVLFSPYWVSFPEQIRLAGAEAVVVDTTAESGFQPTAEQLDRVCDEKTRAVILNSPCNPTGSTIPPSEQERFVSVVERRGLLLISDECYEAFVYGDQKPVSFIPFRERIRDRLVIVNSFSKTYAMTGWRVGFMLGPGPVLKAVKKLQSHDATHTAAIAQWAAVAALEQAGDFVVEMREEFRKRRDLLLDQLETIPGITCHRPTGAFYAFPNLEGLYTSLGVDSTRELAARLIRDAGIATVPGEAFGRAGHIRLSYALSRDRLQEGMERLRRLVESA
jgi:aspartate aminotransferase